MWGFLGGRDLALCQGSLLSRCCALRIGPGLGLALLDVQKGAQGRAIFGVSQPREMPTIAPARGGGRGSGFVVG